MNLVGRVKSMKTKTKKFGKENQSNQKIKEEKSHNNALNHDRPHLQTLLFRGRLVLHTRLVVCKE